jgi:hypothetical protein
MNLKPSRLLFSSPRAVLTTIFGNIKPWLQQPWNKTLLNTIWIIQFFYGCFMVGTGVNGLAALNTSPISDQATVQFKTLVPRHSPILSMDTKVEKYVQYSVVFHDHIMSLYTGAV